MTLATRSLTWADNNDNTFTATNAVALDGDDDSTVFSLPVGAYAMSIQVTGTFDSATVALQGSSDGTNWVALPTAVSFTAAGGGSVADLGFKRYRLFVSGGGGTTALTATVYVRTV